ncbi:MAG: DUF502 domain-containing protein [Bacteroidota bacterium]|nr:DUF502 domain-containing protein [Bacteroidota bacterium]
METFFVAKVSQCYFFMNGKILQLVSNPTFDPMNKEMPDSKGFQFSKLLQYFLQGLLVLAPIAITIYAVYSVVSFIDNQVPIFTAKDVDGKVYVRNYGLGFLLVIGAIILTGYLSSFFIKNRMFNLFDSIMKRTPGIRFIYSTTKEFFEAFAGEKKKFNKPVIANIDDNDVWRVGFITREEAKDFGFTEYVAVYIPMSYSIAGNVFILPRNRVKIVTNLNATDAMKFAISGGVTQVEEKR